MHLRIRWKLILSIGLPVLGVYALILVMDYRSLREAALTQTRFQAERTADLYAARLDRDLESAAQLARSGAEYVGRHASLTEHEIDGLLTANLDQNPRVFGSCLAFEPGAYAMAPRLFAPYVYRSGEGIARKDIARFYDYTQDRWEWYRAPRTSLAPGWTEPYFDEGGGDIIMCTYSAPVVRDGRFIGVVTVDLDVTALQTAIDPADLAEGLFVIVSREGRYIWHPDPTQVLKQTVKDTARQSGRADIEALAERLVSGGRGTAAFPSPWRPGRSELFFYSPIPSAGWCFVAVRDLEAATSDVAASLGRRGGLLLAGLAGILGVIFVVGSWITRPVGALMEGVREVAAGQLDATITGVRSRDELGELAAAFNGMVARLRGHVEDLAKARADRDAVEFELRLARDIQMSLLPRTFPAPPEHTAFALSAVCRPAKAVGGDFYDFLFSGPDVLFFLIADVSGKGVPAAMYMAVARTLIRDLARAGNGPAEVLTKANEILAAENDTSGMFLTAFVGAYSPATGGFRYACAGHPSPLRVSKGIKARDLGESLDTVVGAIPGIVYQERAGVLQAGERLVLYTDGVTEARTPQGVFFGSDRTGALAEATSGLPPDMACEECVKALEEFQPEYQADDITLMILERRT